MALTKIKALQDGLGITRTTAIRLVTDGEVAGKQIGGRWYVDAAELEKLLTIPSQ
ncbi:helix-turn-helix domain-containing protein [Williamsia sp. SKLECPSW1]